MKQFINIGAGIPFILTANLDTKQHILADGAPREQAVLLQHIADITAAADDNAARSRRQQTGRNGKQRGFSTARGADNTDNLPLIHREGQIPYRFNFTFIRLIC
ncbi:hypothetical protein SDC9_182705 [bioreactor metagenome]|uniref:Uncharacterized protein n=1 Tax=bioreactor metagenome TaxID=1076179 RepID=A0A645H8A0_9ZZZZ